MLLNLLAYIGPFHIFLIVIASLLILLFPLFALISVISNDFHGNDKLIWVLVIIFFPFFGALMYFLIGRNRQIRR